MVDTTDLPFSDTQELAALVREHVLPACALHLKPSSPGRYSLHAAVSSQAQKRAMVGLQLHETPAATTGHNLEQAVAGGAFRVHLE